VFDRCGSCYDRGNCDAPFLEWCLIEVGVVMIVTIVMLLVGMVFDRCGSCYDRGNCDAPFWNGV